jgi:hypothetical protein
MSDQAQRAFSTAFKESVVLRLRAGERGGSYGQSGSYGDMIHIA